MVSKLPKDRAYPLSLSLVKEKITSVPQFSEIRFAYQAFYFMSEARRKKTKYGKANKLAPPSAMTEVLRANYDLAAVGYSTPNAHLKESSFLNKYTRGRWRLDVCSAPLEELARVRECFERDGFAKLQDWLRTAFVHDGEIGRYQLSVLFDGERLVYKEVESR